MVKSLKRFQKGHALMEAVLSDLHLANPDEIGTLEQWSVKDTLAHITAWQKTWVNWLQPVAEGKPLDPQGPENLGDDENERNARIYEEYAQRSWEDVLDESRRVFKQFEELYPLLSDDDLENPDSFEWLGERPLARRLAGNFYWHPETHVVEACLMHQQVDRAVKIAEAFAAKVNPDEPETDRAEALYNLGCVYARAKKPKEAIAVLHTALALNPDLTEWSKQDKDLDSLRKRAEFKALYST